MQTKTRATIRGLGSYLPERVLTNEDLEEMVDTTDEWIFSRTGIKERRIAAPEQATSDLAALAAERALDRAGVSRDAIDLILVATTTPDHLTPSTAALVQARLQMGQAAAVDLFAACSGFLYGLSMAKAYVESGMYRNILLIAAEKMSTFVDYTDRSTCVLFGDGASAAVITGEGDGFVIEAIDLGCDGTLGELIIVPAGGTRQPTTTETLRDKQHCFKMQGREVFKHAVRRMGHAAQTCLDKVGLSEEQISWLVPHQANIRILEAMAKRFQISMDRVYKTVHKYGNMSSSSVAVAFDELTQEEPLSHGEHVLLVAFGAGLTWGAAVLTCVQKEVDGKAK